MLVKGLHPHTTRPSAAAVLPWRQARSPTVEPAISPLPDPLPLRAHMALCLLGFRGSGYSAGFVEQMQAIQDGLKADPSHAVALVDAPDRICDACPNLGPEGCTLGGPTHEAHMQAHDREVLRRLGFETGVPSPWSAVLEAIGASIRGADLDAICTTCPWLPLGVCRESVDALCGSPGTTD